MFHFEFSLKRQIYDETSVNSCANAESVRAKKFICYTGRRFRTVEIVDELARVLAHAASLVRILTILFCRVKSDSKFFRRHGDFVHFGRSFLQIRRVSFIMERIDGDPPFGVLDSGVVFLQKRSEKLQ